jgi:hypothetical protein
MPQVTVRSDALDAANRGFKQTPLSAPVFLNSVPKSGSHLLRNVLRMFVPLEQHYSADFIQWPNLKQHLRAFDPAMPKLSWGHLFFADASAIETAPARRILLYRDPYDWVIARARFFVSEQFSANLDHLRSSALTAEELLTMMIFGIPGKAPSLNDIYELNAAAWLGARCHVVKFEDLSRHVASIETEAAEAFFGSLLKACGMAMPTDWRQRVAVGADRRQSGTARENLTGVDIVLPETLGAKHRALVDYQAPGLRGLLGYA